MEFQSFNPSSSPVHSELTGKNLQRDRVVKVVQNWKAWNNSIFLPLVPGYALDPSVDNPEAATKYIGSVEEAEKNQGS